MLLVPRKMRYLLFTCFVTTVLAFETTFEAEYICCIFSMFAAIALDLATSAVSGFNFGGARIVL